MRRAGPDILNTFARDSRFHWISGSRRGCHLPIGPVLLYRLQILLESAVHYSMSVSNTLRVFFELMWFLDIAAVKGRNTGFSTTLRFGRNDEFVVTLRNAVRAFARISHSSRKAMNGAPRSCGRSDWSKCRCFKAYRYI